LLYASVIRHDDRVGKQLTILGSFMALVADLIIRAGLFLAIGYGIEVAEQISRTVRP
jgi:hypothetical protein